MMSNEPTGYASVRHISQEEADRADARIDLIAGTLIGAFMIAAAAIGWHEGKRHEREKAWLNRPAAESQALSVQQQAPCVQPR